ncbi:DNA-directed DNA polymerase gamma mip1 [Serendipita sp. 399]|nr:DNA-directed DNA polymerase gamma mip1 [Serendipita sp. 399]
MSSSSISIKPGSSRRRKGPSSSTSTSHYEVVIPKDDAVRNPAGVQLLPHSLHKQLFRNVSFDPPSEKVKNISKFHLSKHGLDPTKAQKVDNINFTLPPLEGATIDQHFHNIGTRLAVPTRDLAHQFAACQVPQQPQDSEWRHWSGWTKYTLDSDGRVIAERNVGPSDEAMLVFDVETMPKYHNYAVMACAVSSTAWYCWISPWLLKESDQAKHLIPLGPTIKGRPRIVIGHNVSYDRARVLEDYQLGSESGICWIDTMSFHVAVKGISSVQRPAWMAWRKTKKEEEIRLESDVGEDEQLPRPSPLSNERLLADMETEMELEAHKDPEQAPDSEFERWESITSINSLLEVARLYCGIKMNKETRNAFIVDTPEDIKNELTKYLSYCATDVSTTHAVFQKVFPLFLEACPHPVSWVGVMRMGSSILTVNQEWEHYLERAEAKYRELEGNVKLRLMELAEETKGLMESGAWKGDVFLQQMDWTPKTAGKSRGYWVPTQKELKALTLQVSAATAKKGDDESRTPRWLSDLKQDPKSHYSRHVVIPLLLRPKLKGRDMFYTRKHGWIYRNSPTQKNSVFDEDIVIKPRKLGDAKPFVKEGATIVQLSVTQTDQQVAFWTKSLAGFLLDKKLIRTYDDELARDLAKAKPSKGTIDRLLGLAEEAVRKNVKKPSEALSVLDWSVQEESSTPVAIPPSSTRGLIPHIIPSSLSTGLVPPDGLKYPPPKWPQWYWDLAKPRKDAPRGTIDITVRNRMTPLLLRLGWLGHPLVHSRQHGWCYRVEGVSSSPSPLVDTLPSSNEEILPLTFEHEDDEPLRQQSSTQQYRFYKLPHPHGQSANVGSPLSKSFIKYAQDGTLKSMAKTTGPQAEVAKTAAVAVDHAKNALEMNAQCSYWISARDRVLNQMVVWEERRGQLGVGGAGSAEGNVDEKWGVILPQVITMGTVTRRAIEKTWLTASNAKSDRVGSELKAMVRAPPGYAIVGADVDSEEMWISSVMGDSQFGIHGATAVGWMTLEGTKSQGTDLHSKTASILGISRNAAKVFNYSRIYGAGKRHAVLLLKQANPSLTTAEAEKLAQELYKSTKGQNTHTTEYFGHKFWFGGTESFLFNKLESIAHSAQPTTPALGCRVTTALLKKHLLDEFGSDYLTSRINWVVQSSGVDYLHLLIASMEYLIEKYSIQARYMISVHDEVRYLVKDEDKYRAAMALQVANLWTRCLFAYKLGFDNLPLSVAFFSALDIDFVLRKEVDMPCTTPSHPTSLAPGESLTIEQLLEKTNNGSLLPSGDRMKVWHRRTIDPPLELGYSPSNPLDHRAESIFFLAAQSRDQTGYVRTQSHEWANKLKAQGRGDEVDKWGTKRSTKSRERRKQDFYVVGESVGLSPDEATLEDLAFALADRT